MATSARVTLADVAKAAQVDVSLVSRVLRGESVRVREETRQRILEQASMLGYRPNAIARSLRSARAGAYGLVIPDFTNPVYAHIISGAEEAAAARGSVVMTSTGSGWDPAAWYDAVDGGRVDGLLVAGGPTLDMSRLAVPYVLVNRAVPGGRRYVVLDDARASRMAVDHLIGLGHSRIVFLGGPDDADTAQRRRAGFEAALRDAGLDVPEVRLNGDYSAAGGREAMASALRAGPAFTAVVAANVPSALGAMEALREAGVEIPADVSLIAVHDAEIAEYVSPALTTVKMPLHELGARAIDLLARTPADEPIEEVVAQPMELTIRASTGPAPR
ncbi:LacI family transcriptional regulator [Aeromicrobium camelliae]|uniref:LacI family transcriptional regulator n=1 Tax=Aeromicrobium camelliae TaxID=1538144 RepID=A0A3N6YGU1_9ACTN|nr:LacI family DNA-binding transcriptional regulator [Aeromicrobium camelliae]RQN08994.1 LacI family transcriptional regulator [Aeromicrobium camelliae]